MQDHERHPPEKDPAATTPVPSERSDDEPESGDDVPQGEEAGGRQGGPLGNPEVDEESLRKQQEERRRGGE